MIDARLITDVKGAEGCRLVAYRDSLGLWTIGYGHELDQTIDWSGHEITQVTADALLAQDLEQAQAETQLLSDWSLLDTPCRQNAVVELVFNMGVKHWLGFRLCRAAIANQDWKEASDQLITSKWAVEVGARRSLRLSNYLLTGQYPCQSGT
jgi:GH24 family phage-related lysozyme (muramidase)